MSKTLGIHIRFSMVLLLGALAFGMLSSFAFLAPEYYNRFLPFHQLRPMHVSAALFWIITGATAGVLYFSSQETGVRETAADKVFVWTWIGSIALVFCFYAFRKFGGREYWEFPPMLGVPVLVAWAALMVAYYKRWQKRIRPVPLYVWMWSTGILFFLITFLEQNLYQIPWFRESLLRDITVQWKSNGAMVGAWNQMIYGSSLFLMVKISGDEQIARSKKAYFFYFLGLSNLMFNWGHHIYNVPGASWIRHVSYAISMTEWLIFINIVRSFRAKLQEDRKHNHMLTYRFLSGAEHWVSLNLMLALMMSVPAINRYTHGTHVTVAHAMGATIGINSMILLGILSYILKADGFASVRKAAIAKGLRLAHLSLFVFWIALITAGLLKGYRDVALGMSSFQEMMAPVMSVLKVFSFAGVFLFLSMSVIVWQLMAGKVVTVDEGSFVKPVAIPSTLPSEPLKKTVL